MKTFGYSENHLYTGKIKPRDALETRDEGAYKVVFKEHNEATSFPNSFPFGLAQVLDVTSFFWVMLLSWFSKCGPQTHSIITI